MKNDEIIITKVSHFSNLDKDYAYAYCSCIKTLDEAIRIPRPEQTGFITVTCPRCGEKIEMIVSGKKSFIDFSKKF